MRSTIKFFRCSFSICFILFLYGTANAQAIKGTVLDSKTGEPMVGATASLPAKGKSQFVQLDGVFTFRNVDPGTYDLEISYANYSTYHQQVIVKKGATTELKIALESSLIELSEITVTSGTGSVTVTATGADMFSDAAGTVSIPKKRNL